MQKGTGHIGKRRVKAFEIGNWLTYFRIKLVGNPREDFENSTVRRLYGRGIGGMMYAYSEREVPKQWVM